MRWGAAKPILLWIPILGLYGWLTDRGTDLIPDYLQTDEELACQICEMRGHKYYELREGYVRQRCENLKSVEITVDEYLLWAGIEDEKARGIARLTYSMPKGPKYSKRSVEMTYSVPDESGQSVEIAAICTMVFEDGKIVETANGRPAHLQLRDESNP